MQSRDGRLRCVRTGAAAKRFLHQRERFGDLPSIPAPAILLLENNQITSLVHARIAPGIV
jgi:hypothetical protein